MSAPTVAAAPVRRDAASRIYEETVRPLPQQDRLRLAALILNDIAPAAPPPDAPTVDESDDWTDEDKRDVTAFSLRYAETVYPEEEPLV